MVFECDSYRYSSLAMKQEERQGRKIKSQHWTNVFLPTTARLVKCIVIKNIYSEQY